MTVSALSLFLSTIVRGNKENFRQHLQVDIVIRPFAVCAKHKAAHPLKLRWYKQAQTYVITQAQHFLIHRGNGFDPNIRNNASATFLDSSW